MHDEKANLSDNRFLLIKQWGYGFWSDMHDVWSKLLLSEITDRIPVVYWGKDSWYSVSESCNSFEQYFLPVSDYSVEDVVSDKFTYYPPQWNFTNIFIEDTDKISYNKRDIEDSDKLTYKNRSIEAFINSNENILVSDTYTWTNKVIPFIKDGHPMYHHDEDDICRYMHQKYLKLQPDIEKEINDFYQAYMQTRPILALHIRAGAKLTKDPHWAEIIELYPQEINNFLKEHPSGRVFLLTDDESVLKKYKQMYGDILIYTDCTRKTSDDVDLSLKVFKDRRRKGIDIIKDTYLAAKCDYFVGNWGSNVSRAVRRLKVWDNDKIKMFS